MICGVDVSKQTLEVRVEQEGPGGSFANSQEGIAQLADFCRAQQVHLVAMEASGGYEKLPFALLWAEQIAVTIVNPRAVRRFAEGMGYLEKTDALDAGVIAHFARTKKSKPCSPASAQEQHLRALVTRLRQLTEVQTAQSNQRLLVTDSTVQELCQQMLTLVKKQIRRLEKAIAQLIGADPLWQQLDASFRTIKAVSYTHLDVYKRQAQDKVVVESQRPELLPLDLQSDCLLYTSSYRGFTKIVRCGFLRRKPRKRPWQTHIVLSK